MPVGTKGTVKSARPRRAARARRVDRARQHVPPALPAGRGARSRSSAACTASWAGTGRSSPTPGGFQVFSLRDTLLAVDDDGVTFRSVYDGTRARFTPGARGAHPARPRLGRRHVPRRLPAGRRLARRARGGRPADDALGAAQRERRARARASSRFGISQGAADPELRRRSIDEIARARLRRLRARRARGRGGPRTAMLEAVGWAAPLLPADQPRYFMGIGDPRASCEVIERGIDMFDCVLPTRTARTGSALTRDGPPQPPQRPLRARPASARGGLPLPGVRPLLARVPAPPREPGGAARAAAAQPA